MAHLQALQPDAAELLALVDQPDAAELLAARHTVELQPELQP